MKRSYVLFLAMILVSAHPARSESPAAAPAPLFAHVKADLPTSIEPGPQTGRGQKLRVNFEALQAARPGTRVRLSLLAERDYVGILKRVDRRDARHYTWYGELEDMPTARFIIVAEEEAVAAVVDDPKAEAPRIHIRYLGDGVHFAYEIDRTNEPRCEGAREVEPSANEGTEGIPVPNNLPFPYEPVASACQRPDRIVDLIIMYTKEARIQAGGVNAIRSQCQLGVAWTNEAYANSLIPLQMRLVGAFETAYDESGRNPAEMLIHLAFPNDGYIDEVYSVLFDYRADLVALWYHDGGGYGSCCVDEVGFSVSGWSGAGAGALHAHETGHNFGCAHNIENVDCSGCFLNSHGHRFVGDDRDRYITIMSYATGDYQYATTIQHFSNPDVSYAGQPTGTTDPFGDNCANTIRQRMAGVEGFALTRLDVWVDFRGSFIQSGSFEYPYDSVAAGAHNIATIYDVGFVPFPTLHVKAGSTAETLTIDKRMRIEPCGGPVRLGGSW